jgi:hypothetical protein
MSSEISPNRPILLLGAPRSGTTLLQLMMHAHPRLAVPAENRWVLPAYYGRHMFGDLTKPDNRSRLARFITDTRPAFKNFGLPAQLVHERVVSAPPTLGSGLEAVMRCYAERVGAARWCDKRPAYFRHVPALLRLYPDAQFVHLIRDGRAVASSLLRTPWFRGDIAQAIGTWRMAMEDTAQARARLPAERWLDLRFEELLVEPEQQLRRLSAFLGEEFDPRMLEPAAVKAQVVPERKTWHANTGGDLLPARIDAWRSDLPPAEIAFLEAVAGRQLRAVGYRTAARPRRVDARRVASFAVRYRRRAAWHRRQRRRDNRAAERAAERLESLYRTPGRRC